MEAWGGWGGGGGAKSEDSIPTPQLLKRKERQSGLEPWSIC